MKNTHRVLRVSEALSEAVGAEVSQRDLLRLASVIVETSSQDSAEEFDRPLNFSAPNFYSMAVDRAISQQGFALASKANIELEDFGTLDGANLKRRFDDLCREISML